MHRFINNKGIVQLKKGNFIKAIEYFNKVLSQNKISSVMQELLKTAHFHGYNSRIPRMLNRICIRTSDKRQYRTIRLALL